MSVAHGTARARVGAARDDAGRTRDGSLLRSDDGTDGTAAAGTAAAEAVATAAPVVTTADWTTERMSQPDSVGVGRVPVSRAYVSDDGGVWVCWTSVVDAVVFRRKRGTSADGFF